MDTEMSLKKVKNNDMKIIEIQNYESVLIVQDAKTLRVTANNIFRSLKEKPIIYINLIHTYNSLISSFKIDEINTDNIFFIDCITKLAGGKNSEHENVLFIQEPDDLTSLSIAISQFFEDIPGEKWLIFYAFKVLKIYNKEKTILEFIQSIIEKASKNNAKIIAFSTKIKDEKLIRRISQFFEKIIMEIE